MLRLWASVMRRSKSASVPSLGLTLVMVCHIIAVIGHGRMDGGEPEAVTPRLLM
mgnify:CR=1 FL=1